MTVPAVCQLNEFSDDCLTRCCLDYECLIDTEQDWCEDQGGFWSFLIDCDNDPPCGVPQGACCLVSLGMCLEEVSEIACDQR